MSKKQLKNYLIPTMLLALMAMPLPAHAGFGTGIGVTFPISGSSSGERINNTYAALEYDVLTEELNIMEKHGRLVMEFKISNTSDKPYTIQQKPARSMTSLSPTNTAANSGNGLTAWPLPRRSPIQSFPPMISSSTKPNLKAKITAK
jgi:hypothetical protein